MTRLLILLLLLGMHTPLTAQQTGSRPKIGLTLSGGGAKGLAHIGILKAVDSAGLNIDYITGTSMGGIVGALYATGYSAAAIVAIARQTDWDVLLSNQSSLRAIVMEEKDEYSKYAIELPWINHGFRLPTGVIESEELWLKFSELFFPVYSIKDFSEFSIPFKCIGTDISTGDIVVMDKGEIATAVRATMAIPSVFTAVDYQGRKLVDGGIVRNLPVEDVREMGADVIIASKVSTGLMPGEKLTSAIQILLQIAFFKEAYDNRDADSLADIFLDLPVDDFHAGSFNRDEEILQIGIDQGRLLYPRLKALKDSLDQLYGPMPYRENRLPKVDSIKISGIRVHGDEQISRNFIINMMSLEEGKYYTPAKLSNLIRKVFGTRYYNRIVYTLEPVRDGSAIIHFDVIENPVTFAKLGIHYNKFTGIGVLMNLTSRNFVFNHSRSLISVNLSESFRARAEHLQYLGRGKDVALVLGGSYERFDVASYNRFKRDGLYGMQYFKSDARLQYSANRKFTVGAGTRFEWVRYSPSIQSVIDVSGKNEFVTSYLFAAINTLDKAIFPNRGFKMDVEAGTIFNQTPHIRYYSNGTEVDNIDSLGITYNNYYRLTANAEGYIPLSNRLNFYTGFQSGINVNYKQNILNDFAIGGMAHVFRNQVLFAGLEENAVITPSVASLQLALRYRLFNNIFLTARSNGLINNFVSTNNIIQKPNFLSGHALTFGYNLPLGPLEISVMYNDQSRQVRSYINLGIAF